MTTKTLTVKQFLHSPSPNEIRDLAQRYRTATPGGATLTIKDAIEAYLRAAGTDQHLRLARHVLADQYRDEPLGSLTEDRPGHVAQ